MLSGEISIRDPFVLPFDGRYYLYGTRAVSFGRNTGGFDVYESVDLVNWSERHEVFDSAQYGLNREVNWAPEVHAYGGSFYLFATFTKENNLRGTYILRASSPCGPFVPWSDGAVTPFEWECLDGTFLLENGKPYCVFCHEHTQILDGTVCALELSADLKKAVGEPRLLFRGSDFHKETATPEHHLVTDGPFLYRHSNGSLLMIWSTIRESYYQCVAVSDNGALDGSWHHLPPLFREDGGHGMIFRDFGGELRLTLHTPNESGLEHPVFFTLRETKNALEIVKA